MRAGWFEAAGAEDGTDSTVRESAEPALHLTDGAW
jgi:hypothetical protein